MKLFVLLSDNREEIIEVETFDIQAFNEEMKNHDGTGIVIGDQYFWKIDIRHIKEYQEEVSA